MPYSTPTDQPIQGRPGHRRSYSHITPPSTYTSTSPSLNHLPRRKSTTTVDSPQRKFQLGHDDDDDSSGEEVLVHHDDDRSLPPLRLKLKESPFDAAARRGSPPPIAIPFPRSSPTVSPSPSMLFPVNTRTVSENNAPAARPRLLRPSVSRTSSSPILLSNGKPLKSSLKSSSSSPNIPFPPQSLVPSIMFPELHHQQHSHHQRARSAPSTPLLQHADLSSSASSSSSQSPPPSPTLSTHKNVHFPSQEQGGLATVRVFNRSAKPASLSRLGEETETETEGESSTGGWGGNRWNIRGDQRPFPKIAAKNASPLSRPHGTVLDTDMENSTPIPARGAEKGDGNVYLESIGFVRQDPTSPAPQRPLTLTGTMLVRNVTYQKTVAIRFTLDDWHTTNDVLARHERSLAALPGRFVRGASGQDTRVCSPYTVDSVGDAVVPLGDAPAWDRFRFDIKLEDYADTLETRTMWLVGRYSAGIAPASAEAITPVESPAEWWDNNMGANYRVAFVRREREQDSHQVHKRGVIVSAPSVYSPVRPAATSPSKSHLSAPQISASLSFPSSFSEQHQQQIAQRREHQAAMTQSTLARLKKLNLKNYAAPAAYTPPPPPSVDTSSTSTSADSTPLQTPTQGDDVPEFIKHREASDGGNADVLDADMPTPTLEGRPGWGGGMSMEGGFPATTVSMAGDTTPTLRSLGNMGLINPSELGTSPPFSSMMEMANRDTAPSATRGGKGVYWPWGSFGNVASGEGKKEEQAADAKPVDIQQEQQVEERVTPPLSPPVASLLSGIKEKSMAPTSGSGLGQLAPPQRRKASGQNASNPTFTLGGSPSSSSSESSVDKLQRHISPPPTSTPSATPVRPSMQRASTTTGTFSPPYYPGSPKRYLSPLPSSQSPPASLYGNEKPVMTGARSPLRLSPVNSTSDMQESVGADAAGVQAKGQDDAVYQAFVRQWCFAQAPGPTVGASVGASTGGGPGRVSTPAMPGVGA